MLKHWQDNKERAHVFWIKIVVWLSMVTGRTITRLVMRFVSLGYLYLAPDAVAASRNYLQRIDNKAPSFKKVWDHFFYFATVSIDRLYFLSGKSKKFNLRIYGEELLQKQINLQQGCIILVSHVGSFDALRGAASERINLPLKIVMDHTHNAQIMSLIDAINPDLASCIIDSSAAGSGLAIELSENVNNGVMIGLMADRVTANEAQIHSHFLGEDAAFPYSPWLLASVLKVPILTCFGLYKGSNIYELHIEQLSDGIHCKRKDRQTVIAQHIQQYANRIEYHLSHSPLNWFNFYDFWYKASNDENKNDTSSD